MARDTFVRDQVTAEMMRAELVRFAPIVRAAYQLERAVISGNTLSISSALTVLRAARIAGPQQVPYSAEYRLWVLTLVGRVGPTVASRLSGVSVVSIRDWEKRRRAIEGLVPPLKQRHIKARSKTSRIELGRALEAARAEIRSLTGPDY